MGGRLDRSGKREYNYRFSTKNFFNAKELSEPDIIFFQGLPGGEVFISSIRPLCIVGKIS